MLKRSKLLLVLFFLTLLLSLLSACSNNVTTTSIGTNSTVSSINTTVKAGVVPDLSVISGFKVIAPDPGAIKNFVVSPIELKFYGTNSEIDEVSKKVQEILTNRGYNKETEYLHTIQIEDACFSNKGLPDIRYFISTSAGQPTPIPTLSPAPNATPDPSKAAFDRFIQEVRQYKTQVILISYTANGCKHVI